MAPTTAIPGGDPTGPRTPERLGGPLGHENLARARGFSPGGGALRVRRLISARNAIYFHGEPAEEFTVGPGEDFRIGQTVFRLDAVSPEAG